MYMTKESLLITGGCSNSADTQFGGGFVKDYIKNNILIWPKIVAEKLNMKLLNVAMGAASNDYIENMIYDAIIENHNKYNCIVMIFWTSGQRINLFDQDTIWDFVNFTNTDHNKNKKLKKINVKKIINKSFRNMKRTKVLCEYYKIPLVQRVSLPLLHEPHWEDVKTWAMDHPDINELNLSWPEIYNGRWSSKYYKKSDIVSKELHPNQNGQKLIAQMFIDSLNGEELEILYDGRIHDGGGYVYD